ncbi:uncharacterized protein LOC144307296 isoform X2 [Canis aureus]
MLVLLQELVLSSSMIVIFRPGKTRAVTDQVPGLLSHSSRNFRRSWQYFLRTFPAFCTPSFCFRPPARHARHAILPWLHCGGKGFDPKLLGRRHPAR